MNYHIKFIVIFTLFLVLCKGENIQGDSATNNHHTTQPKKQEIDYAKYRKMYATDIAKWPKPTIDEGIEWREMESLPKIAPSPANNPHSEEKQMLGNLLFNERMLSKSGQFACASCHHKELSFTDGLSTSFGHDRVRGRRNSINIMMSGFFENLFWDGRANSLENQSLMPITDPIEMAHTLDEALESIKQIPHYYPLFILAFGDENSKNTLVGQFPKLFEKNIRSYELQKQNLKHLNKSELEKIRQLAKTKFGVNYDIRTILSWLDDNDNKLSKEQREYAKSLITIQNLTHAIASYERSLVPQNTKFNRFLKGQYQALSDKQIYGLHIFRTKGRCMNCHYGVALSDGKFHNIGLSFYGKKLEDLGRYEVTQEMADKGAFRTPSLIAISKTAPYMHNGIFPSLRGIINMYNAGFPTTPQNPPKDYPTTTSLIKPLKLNIDEIEALEAFLESL